MSRSYTTNTPNVNPLKCRKCDSRNLELRDGSGPHYKGIWCLDCHSFVKWLPKPKEHQLLAEAIFSSSESVLTPWERTFLAGVASAVSLTPKQTEVLENIARRCGHE